MLLRLHVRGFKNLRDVEIRFGPLTCLVGPNGAGKSNLFDAIQFLRLLADNEVQRAAEAVRSPAAGRFGPEELFWRQDSSGSIAFSADMIAPAQVVDDFGQSVEPATTLLRYEVEFRCEVAPHPRLVLVREDLSPLKRGGARDTIGFEHSPRFRSTAVLGKRFGGAFISTNPREGGETAIQLHQDGGSRGRGVRPGNSPRTVLGGTGAADYPTVVAARREMSSWHALHLEPSSLRAPDGYGDRSTVDEHGRHIAATLLRLSKAAEKGHDLLAEAANRLARLVPDVEGIRVADDQVREQIVVVAKLRGNDEWFRPRSLSDGTLRFLALIAMELDPGASRVLCMEEPENGIDPRRIPDLIQLLRDYAVDPDLEVGADNQVRQIVLNSHSPDVLKQLDAREVLFVDTLRGADGAEACVRPVQCAGNWRANGRPVTFAQLREVMRGAPVGDPLQRQMELESELPG